MYNFIISRTVRNTFKNFIFVLLQRCVVLLEKVDRMLFHLLGRSRHIRGSLGGSLTTSWHEDRSCTSLWCARGGANLQRQTFVWLGYIMRSDKWWFSTCVHYEIIGSLRVRKFRASLNPQTEIEVWSRFVWNSIVSLYQNHHKVFIQQNWNDDIICIWRDKPYGQSMACCTTCSLIAQETPSTRF